MRTRTYTYVGPIGAASRRRGRERHELVVHPRGGARGAAAPCELDGRPISRESAAWVLWRWRKSRRGVGVGLWRTVRGEATGEGGAAR